MTTTTTYRWQLTYGSSGRMTRAGSFEALSDAGAVHQARCQLKKLRDECPRSRELVLKAETPHRIHDRYVASCIVRGGTPAWHYTPAVYRRAV